MTRYDLFRRRIGPIAFGLAIALLARESCNKQQRTHATVQLDFGDAAARVRAVDAEVLIDNESIATFHRVALADLAIGPTKFVAALPSPDAELDLDIDLGTEHRHLIRHVHADEGATVTVSLAADLAPRAR